MKSYVELKFKLHEQEDLVTVWVEMGRFLEKEGILDDEIEIEAHINYVMVRVVKDWVLVEDFLRNFGDIELHKFVS